MARPRPGIGAELVPLFLVLASLGGTVALVIGVQARYLAEHAAKPESVVVVQNAPKPILIPPPPAPEAEPAPEPAPIKAAPALPPPEDPTPKVVARISKAEAEQRSEAESLARKIKEREAELKAAESEASAFRAKVSSIQSNMEPIVARAERIEMEAARASIEVDALERYRAEQKDLVAKVGSRTSYAILPHRGPNGTWRRPIVLECFDGQVAIRPNGPKFGLGELLDVPGFGNSTFRGLVAREAIRVQRGMTPDGRTVVPYFYFLIRPDGVKAYYAARRQLEPLGISFGYELVDADWEIEFPNLDEPENWLPETLDKVPVIPDAFASQPGAGGGGSGQPGTPGSGVTARSTPGAGAGNGLAGGPGLGNGNGNGNGLGSGLNPPGSPGFGTGLGSAPGSGLGTGPIAGPVIGSGAGSKPGQPGNPFMETAPGRPGGSGPGLDGPGKPGELAGAGRPGGTGPGSGAGSDGEKPGDNPFVWSTPSERGMGRGGVAGLPGDPGPGVGPMGEPKGGLGALADGRPSGGNPPAGLNGEFGSGMQPAEPNAGGGLDTLEPFDSRPSGRGNAGTGLEPGRPGSSDLPAGLGEEVAPRSAYEQAWAKELARRGFPEGTAGNPVPSRETAKIGEILAKRGLLPGNLGSGGGGNNTGGGEGGSANGSPSQREPGGQPGQEGQSGQGQPSSDPGQSQKNSFGQVGSNSSSESRGVPGGGGGGDGLGFGSSRFEKFEIVIACESRGVAIHPGDYRVTARGLAGKDPLLSSQLKGLVKARMDSRPDKLVVPSIKFLVEPGGHTMYARARTQIALDGIDWPTTMQVSGGDMLRGLSREDW